MLIFIFAYSATAQVTVPKTLRKATASQDEIISMRNTLSFSEAIDEFNVLSKRHLNKIIVDPIIFKGTIGIDIDNIYWFDAFGMILEHNDLLFEEYSDHILVKLPELTTVNEELLSAKRYFVTREVVISTIFFEANRTDLSQLGVSWGFLDEKTRVVTDMLTGEPSLETIYKRGLEQSSADNKTGVLNFDFFDKFDFGDISAIFKTLASNHLGEIIASPKITVLSNNEGFIQIGSDFSVTVQDFAGNTVTQFFSTGSIITVTPHVINVDSVTFIHIELDAQKSSATSSELGVEVKKSSAKTSLLLLDGEETIIGGLYSNEESETREGIPFLKDLPWWFLGLRYLFGYESVNMIQKELIILLKVDLVPSLTERIENRLHQIEKDNKLQDGLMDFNQQRDQYLEQIENHKESLEQK